MNGERQPLLREARPAIAELPLNNNHLKSIVDFDRSGDAENPLEWPDLYKWTLVTLLALTAFTVTFTCISVVPIANQIIAELEDGHGSKSASVLLVTIWELGEAAGPLFIAPLSELFGRYPVVNAANCLFIAATAISALSPSSQLLIAARFLTGLAVASNVLNPAIVGDIFASEQRGAAMSLVMLTPLIGGAVGPSVGAVIADHLGWRAVLWISAALAALCELAFVTCFRETYKPAILARRAKKLRKETGNLALQTVIEMENSIGKNSIWRNVMRPLHIMYSSSVLQVVTLFGGVIYAYFYIMSTSLPDILGDVYGLNPTQCGLAFICFSVGSTVSVAVCNLFLDRLYIRLGKSNKGISLPEHRLPFTIAGAFLFPVVVALYGWVPQAHLPLPAELTMVGLWGLGLMIAELPLIAYVVDAYGLYSASAMTAMIVMRCFMGTFLPMATDPLVRRLGWGWGMTVFAGVGLVLAPIPVLIMRYGAKWRQWSLYSRDHVDDM